MQLLEFELSFGQQPRLLAEPGFQILGAAARQSPELRDALALWKETKFEFDEVDHLDLASAGSSPERRTPR